MAPDNPSAVETELDGSTTAYYEIDVRGDRVERLATELFRDHWRQLTVGPLLQGAVFELRFAEPPRVAMLDGYLTVDLGAAGHFHLCVNDHRDCPSAELAAIRRVGRAAFFRTTQGARGGHATASWGLRCWNGRGEQMLTILFPSPHYGDSLELLAQPDWGRLALWDRLRERYARA